ncbi:MAG TPA: sigma-54 dependent transcriptional regulator [Blastocatellia bacterium]|nr:sigma-54 dependent transcriptional regulator [Blastocatellia bacterium]
MNTPTILVAEDEDLMRAILVKLLCDEGYRVLEAADGKSALDQFAAEEVALVISDINMAGMDGLALLDQIKMVNADALVIMITAYSSVDTAVAALRKGAYDYITKPFVNEDLLQTVKNALAHQQLFAENRYLRRELKRQHRFDNLIGTSDALQAVFRLIEKVAATNTTILIDGESGTGKELVARAIHYNSDRSDGPFVAINCGALPENLLESELFGYVKGAFTGATTNKRGLLAAADRGTLFLDEIGEMPAALQVKLLRALQQREVTPLGATSPVKFDARIIAATNRNLEADLASGRFREDLYYRLNVISICVPPLRDRREDVPLIARHFIRKLARERGAEDKRLDGEALRLMMNYDWPGNVRELENCIERAFTLSGSVIDVDVLPPKLRVVAAHDGDVAAQVDDLEITLEDLERRYILQTLERFGGDKASAARVLGIDLSTLYRKLNRYKAEGDEPS